MTINLSSGLVGLSLLSGTNGFQSGSGTTFDSAAVIKAKAAFTTPVVTAPWEVKTDAKSPSEQIAAIKAMRTIIDKGAGTDLGDLPDIQTSFTAYKALVNLKVLADSAAKLTTSSSERKSLEATFAKGLADLKAYLGQAPSDLVNLSFSRPTSMTESVGVKSSADAYQVIAKGVGTARDAAVPGLTGNEVLKIDLSRGSIRDSVTVDLSQTTQPPTLDSVAAAINAAIAAVPMRDTAGNIVLDENGDPKARWHSSFAVEKHDGKWGLTLKVSGSERIAIDQVGGDDRLMVVTGQTALDAPASVQVLTFDDPAGNLDRSISGSIAGIDREGTAQAALSANNAKKTGTSGADAPKPAQVLADTRAGAIVTDAQGYSYVVGTTEGDLGANLADGDKDLFLTKLDSEGKVVWQRTLGLAGESSGAAISIAPNGDLVVAGTVQGSDSDMLVARFGADGAEIFSTTVAKVGNESATAVTVGPDGSIFVGGKASTGGGDAYVARLDANGKVQERLTIDSGGADTVTALAVDGSGKLLILTKEDGGTAKLRQVDPQALSTELGSITLGTADARAIAVSDTGEIAVVGATIAPIAGAQVNGMAGGRDGFVTRIDAALGSASTTYIASAGSDQIDSVAYMNGALYVGGRTTGDLGGTRTGAVDGFVSRIDAATGAIETTRQFGRATQQTEPVLVSAATGGDTALGALGLTRGTVNPAETTTLTSQTTLRAGDEFSVSVDGGRVKKVVIEAGETMKSLAAKISKITGNAASVMATTINGVTKLRVTAKAGRSVELVAGAEGRDALVKLGMESTRLAANKPPSDKDPKVKPGGTFGLNLSAALNLLNAKDAAYAAKQLESAISMTQTAYRSLYWDSTKAAQVDGTLNGQGSAYQQRQLANYQAALTRLTGGA